MERRTKMQVKIKKTQENAVIPTRESATAAGYDLYACIQESDERNISDPGEPPAYRITQGETVVIDTGVAMAIPEGYAGFLYARSGLATKRGLRPANAVGVVDADYRGTIKAALHADLKDPVIIMHGDRIAQIVIAPVASVEFEEVDELDETERGAGGFGSTGKN